MQKNLKSKLEKMSKERLLELMEELCNSSDVQKMIKAMVSPSKNDIDRLVQNSRTDAKYLWIIPAMQKIMTVCCRL